MCVRACVFVVGWMHVSCMCACVLPIFIIFMCYLICACECSNRVFSLSLSSVYLSCRTVDLQKRLPSDRVSGTISFNVEHDGLHLEGDSELAIAFRQQLAIQEPLNMIGSLNQEEFHVTSDDDLTPISSLPSVLGEDTGEGKDTNVNQVAMATGGNKVDFRECSDDVDQMTSPRSMLTDVDVSCGSDAPVALQQQLSEPIHRDLVRQVLNGSMQHLGEGLLRQQSQPGRTDMWSHHTPSPITLSPPVQPQLLNTLSISFTSPSMEDHHLDEPLPPSELCHVTWCMQIM